MPHPSALFVRPSVALSGTLNIDVDDSNPGIQDVLNVTNALTLATPRSILQWPIIRRHSQRTCSPITARSQEIRLSRSTAIPDGYTINYNYQNLKEIAFVPLTTPLKLGDFNFDGHVNSADVAAMMTALTDLNKFEANNTLTPARFLTIGDLDASAP